MNIVTISKHLFTVNKQQIAPGVSRSSFVVFCSLDTRFAEIFRPLYLALVKQILEYGQQASSPYLQPSL